MKLYLAEECKTYPIHSSIEEKVDVIKENKELLRVYGTQLSDYMIDKMYDLVKNNWTNGGSYFHEYLENCYNTLMDIPEIKLKYYKLYNRKETIKKVLKNE